MSLPPISISGGGNGFSGSLSIGGSGIAGSASIGGNSVSSAFPASASQDVVAVFDGFSQVFRDARPMKASIRREARLMEHPLENGSTVTDHMVVQPVEIELSMTLTPETFRETYRTIADLFHQGKILSVHTKADSYANLLIQALPHEETPEVFNTVALTLKLKEVTLVRPEFGTGFKAKSLLQTETVDRGEVQPREATNCWKNRRIKW